MALKINETYKVNIINLAKCNVLDEAENEISLYSLWQKQTAIFVFLRHFGCLMCRAHAKQVWDLKDKYQQGGAKVYFIGNGSPHMISKFKEELGIQDAPVYTDPLLTSFKAAGFRRGFLAALGPRALMNGAKLAKEGFRQGEHQKANGDLWQLGGIVVVKPGGKISYFYMSEVAGDYSPEKDGEIISAQLADEPGNNSTQS